MTSSILNWLILRMNFVIISLISEEKQYYVTVMTHG